MSTYLKPSVQSLQEIKDWIMGMLGYPLVSVEITEKQLEYCISDAMELFSEYVIAEKKYLAINLEGYNEEDEYIQIPDYVISIFEARECGDNYSVNTLFSIPNQMANAGMWYAPASGGGYGDWVSYEIGMSYIDLIRRMTASKFTFEYNPRDQHMTLYPNPKKIEFKGYLVIGVYTLRPDEQTYGEYWVKKFALARAKQVIGRVRTKYSGTQLLGGGSIDTAILEEGKQEEETLTANLREKYVAVQFFVG